MIKRIRIHTYEDDIVAVFENRISIKGHPDDGAKVKHYVYKDKNLDAYWHETVYLSKIAEPIRTEFITVSQRKFFGKVRIVMQRHLLLAETWRAIAQSITEIEKINK